MITMTENLRLLAGDRFRNALMRFTRTPASGAITGATCTALMQSSSATTVAVVGFVGAGMMPFSNAIGIVFGANIGSTATGWIVALLGFKLDLKLVVLPLIFLGVMLRLFSQGNRARFGLAIAGFGLIFVGIGQMQDGMADLDRFISFDNLPADTLTGRLKLVAIGIGFTLLTQASSAGVAASLTALYAGMINFEQASSLVIGMDIGTTITAIMASLGGSVGMRRTSASHVIYNLMSASLALFLIDPFTQLWQQLSGGFIIDDAEVALVAFHTTFNTIGVLCILPFSKPFARMICWLFPEPRAGTDILDPALKDQPPLALSAIHRQCTEQLHGLLQQCDQALGTASISNNRNSLLQSGQQLTRAQAFLDDIHLQQKDQPEWQRLVSLLHSLDHLQRLHERLLEDKVRAATVATQPLLDEPRQRLLALISPLQELLQEEEWGKAFDRAQQHLWGVEGRHEALRQEVLDQVATGKLSQQKGTEMLEGLRWLKRVSTHISRILYHLQLGATRSGVSVS